ncbi:SAM domain-containing protein SAMSN-1a isoform X2 [Phyllopteryx taeniolatus]|uniref:SAM domain-containing protein SAMSN-1a isoform X2 n=1 Tax=Phyllopteryx taeniolatus TaxID=161469 RepID=UPI002AD2717D|nr:SAM domain-containing protein SAMSN-1a isoform X2 [Phyllopteryx taeniolatus]
MNLFCFSLEGSMDSLYEAAQTSGDSPPQPIPSRSCSRSCSPALLLDDDARWRGSGRSISMEMTMRPGTNAHKKKIRTQVSKSASDNETLDNAVHNVALWKAAKSPEDLVHIANNHNEVMKRTKHRGDSKGGKSPHHSGTKKRDKNSPSQNINTKGAATEAKPAAKRNQKPGKKTTGKNGKEGAKKSHNTIVHPPAGPSSPPMGPHYLNVPYRSERRIYLGKSSTLPTQENTTPGRCTDMISLSGGATPTHYHNHSHNQRWSNLADNSPTWGTVQHTCRRPLTEYRLSSSDFSLLHGKKMQQHEDEDGSLSANCKPLIPSNVTRSVTDLDLSEPNRSTSFGRFEGLRHNPSAAKAEENGANMLPEECESLEPNKSAGIGKKMKAISLTMRRKMGKKHAKSFSEEMGDDTETEITPATEKNSTRDSNSLESLYSGQSSSSGVTSESNGSGQRDSLRLEEDGSYQGQFCGRARVHTDFVPSPYDTDSLKLKAGDIISIIAKPPMGIWTGMLNNRVGNFKFIYVDVLVEKEEKEEGGEDDDDDDDDDAPKIRQQKLCKRPRPKTLLELLERLNLEEYASALLLNGYQTVEDLTHLQEKHLLELNVKDPEHRRKLLAASQLHYSEGDDVKDVEESKLPGGPHEEDSDCPRDSGCFIPSECSDSKEDAEQLTDTVAS